MSVSIKYTTCFILILILLSSCNNHSNQVEVTSQEKITALNFLDTVKLPPPLMPKYIDPDSIQPPEVVSLKGRPKVIEAHPNVYPVGAPTIRQIPKDLEVLTVGKNGVPLPKTIAAKGKIVPAKHRKRIPAGDFRTKDAAIYNIQFLSDEQGLSYGAILEVIEDSRGHMWFGTTSGNAFRYDGESLFEYTPEEGMLVFQSLTSIVEDSKGNIWFGGWGGLCYYDGQNFVQFTEEEGLGENKASAIMEDSKGNIWFDSKDLYRFDGVNFTIFEKGKGLVDKNQEWQAWFANNTILQIMEDSRGHLWLGTAGSGVVRFDEHHIINLTVDDGLVNNYIQSIFEDSKGNIWFGGGSPGFIGKGVSCFTPDLSSSYNVSGTLINYDMSDGLCGNRIHDILEDPSGNIWFASYEGGVCQFDGQNFTHLSKEEGMSHSGILEFTLDREGNLWAGTNGGGISKIKLNSFQHFTDSHGLKQYPLEPSLEDSKGNIWFGHWYGGILKYDGKQFLNYTTENGLKHNFINQIIEDSDGNLWIAYRDGFLAKFDGKKLSHYSMEQGMISYFIWDIHQDSEGLIWIAGGWRGVTRLNPKTGQITQFPSYIEVGIGGAGIFEDKQQNLWFGGQGYVAKHNKDSDQIQFVCQIDTMKNEWADIMVEDENENLWVSTQHTMAQLKKDGVELKEGFRRLSAGNELPELFISSLTYDNDGNLWIGTGHNGIAVFVEGMKNIGKPDFKWLQYEKADGLKDISYGANALIDSKNRMWWGHTFGTTFLDLNNFQFPALAPENLDLSFIEIDQHYIDYNNLSDSTYSHTLSFAEPLGKSFDSVVAFKNYPHNLQLPFDLNHLTFHFSATDWSAPHQLLYSYKIDGIDKDWSAPSSESKADYRNLPYGTFTLDVKAMGEAQVWSEPYAYTFTISPPWWHTWWAYALYAVFAIMAFGGYVMRLRQKVRRKQEQLEREQSLNIELRELNIATSRFVPRDFIQILNKENLQELNLGDQTQAKMTILFSDIRDYTRISEKMTPAKNFEFINDYLGEMGPIIQKHNGFICQYSGDGFMALFKDNHIQALQAAKEMQRALIEYNRQSAASGYPVIKVGIGLNTGRLMLGVIGDEQRFDTTVISDAVNTASRMEGLTKIFGCQVIVTETTLNEITSSQDDVGSALKDECRYLGKVNVKGKEKVLTIYDFFGGASDDIRLIKSSSKSVFEEALDLYYDRKFGKAADLFKVLLEKSPDDKATKYYMDKSVQYIIDGVDEEWSGVEIMVNK